MAGLVLVSIIQGIIGKQALDVKKIITNTLVAGILIQASRFLVWALVDISTIATASISAFPMTFLKNDVKLKNEITFGLSWFQQQRVFVDLNATGRNNTVTTQPQTSVLGDATRDKILPNQNSVSGPFIYLGMAVFSFQNYLTIQNATSATNLTLGFVLRFFLLFFFTVGLLLLLIANIMRVGLMWVFIIWSPFLILIQVFNKKMWDGKLAKLFSVSNFIAVAFKPLIFVAGISLMLIVIVSMQNSITWSWAGRENNLNGVSLWITGSTSTLSIDWITDISVNQQDILWANVIWPNSLGQAQNFFSHLIMLLLTLFLMRWFIKLSLTIGWWTIEETMKWLVKKAEDMAKSAPVIPFKWTAASLNSAKSFSQQQSKAMLENWLGVNKKWEFFKSEESFREQVNSWMGAQTPWSGKDYTRLEKLAKSQQSADYTNFFSTSQALAKERDWWLSINNPSWMNSVKTILSDATKFNIINKGLGENSFTSSWDPKKSAEEYFKEWNNAKALYKIMWWADAAKWTSAPTDYASLAKITFWPGEE